MGRVILNLSNRNAWRAWLDSHAAREPEAWLVIRKKHATQPGLSLDDAVEEALCFGWIDSTLNTLDDQSYLLRFSPRKPNSVWSMSNIHRVGRLQKLDLMTEAGLVAVRAAQENGQWQAAIDRENAAEIPADLEAALGEITGALAAFGNLSVSRRKQLVYWLQSARREETRQKRIAEIVSMAIDGQ
ncbi:MAG: YdeI/OmpD-associated family protein [Caldilineales bacterium]|nr:YdeI/OmpD-associated family protein [Caldilineales bacterium]